MTPLIDVMLVLLVIFIITAPLFTHAIRLDLPKVASQVARETPAPEGSEYTLKTNLVLRESTSLVASAAKRSGGKRREIPSS